MDVTYSELLLRQQRYHRSGVTLTAKYRLEALEELKKVVKRNEPEILAALQQDLGKSPFESYLSEVGMFYDEVNLMLRKLRSWMKPRRAAIAMGNLPASGKIYPEPYGAVLIFSAWNYPFGLAMSPLIGAIAAGNCVVLKPSELSPATARIISRIINELFLPEYIAVCEGGPEIGESLLRERFDLVFFTGSTAVGKKVYQLAAANLTPVVLELGGKSPCIVDSDAAVELAAKRICWGKFLNAGQTCVAPDYLLVHQKIKDRFVQALLRCIRESFGENPRESRDFPRIVNERHFDRLTALLNEGNILCGGETDRAHKYIAPTVIDNITPECRIMTEEIFGPILPLVEFEDFDAALDFVNSREKPLALYYFSKSKQKQQIIVERTSSGGVCINETIVHLANPSMPFGGVGSSGIGAYHGEHSFRTFSHHKPVMRKPNLPDMPLRYPPYHDWKMKLLRLIFR